MRDLGIADRLRAAGLAVVEVDGWQSRGSDSFSPRGGVDHHTAGSNNGNAPSLEVCINGHSTLSGPLCNTMQGFDGTQYVIASGRANHAGEGSWHGLSGNSSVYGMERENTGHDPGRPGQHESAARAWHAILNGGPAGTIDAGMVCGHKEWSPGRKPDFHDVDYGWFRNQIATGGPPPPPPLTNLEGQTMWCLVRGPDGAIWRLNGATRQHVGDAKMVGGDQIILSWLGLESDYADVAQDWLETWPRV